MRVNRRLTSEVSSPRLPPILREHTRCDPTWDHPQRRGLTFVYDEATDELTLVEHRGGEQSSADRCSRESTRGEPRRNFESVGDSVSRHGETVRWRATLEAARASV